MGGGRETPFENPVAHLPSLYSSSNIPGCEKTAADAVTSQQGTKTNELAFLCVPLRALDRKQTTDSFRLFISFPHFMHMVGPKKLRRCLLCLCVPNNMRLEWMGVLTATNEHLYTAAPPPRLPPAVKSLHTHPQEILC